MGLSRCELQRQFSSLLQYLMHSWRVYSISTDFGYTNQMYRFLHEQKTLLVADTTKNQSTDTIDLSGQHVATTPSQLALSVMRINCEFVRA